MQQLEKLREKIDAIDAAIIKKLAQRQKLVLKIGKLKTDHKMAVKDQAREDRQMHFYENLSAQYELPPIFIKRLFNLIITYSRKLQRL